MDNSEARLAYELAQGKRVSDSHWSNVKKILTHNSLEVNPSTVVFYSKLRKEIPRSSVGIFEVFKCYQRAEKLLINSPKIRGSEILDILAREGISPHPSTISRWFKSLGGFRKTRLYLPEKLTPILAQAFIYKTANQVKLGA